MGMVKSFVHRLGRWYCRRVTRSEYEMQSQWHRITERRIEYRFALDCLTCAGPHTVLDVGTGATAFPHLLRSCGFHVTASDNITDYWPSGMFNRHWHVLDDDITRTRLTQQFDFITCISVLEHIPAHADAVRSMFGLLKPGGRLALTFPYNHHQYVANAYQLPQASYGQDLPFVCQIFSRNEVQRWLDENQGTLERAEYWEVFTGEFWTCGDWLPVPRQTSVDEQHQLACLLLQKSGDASAAAGGAPISSGERSV